MKKIFSLVTVALIMSLHVLSFADVPYKTTNSVNKRVVIFDLREVKISPKAEIEEIKLALKDINLEDIIYPFEYQYLDSHQKKCGDVKVMIESISQLLEKIKKDPKNSRKHYKEAMSKLKLDQDIRSTCTDNRFITNKNDTVELWQVYKGSPIPSDKIERKEAERDTQISTDLGVLLTIIKEKIGIEEKAIMQADTLTMEQADLLKLSLEPKIRKEEPDIKLLEKRGTLTFKVLDTHAIAGTGAEDKKEESKELKIITGPSEHWFLSVDVPVTKVSEIQYDSSTNSLQKKDAPTLFYLGINYMLGDLYAHNQSWSDYVVFKALINLSSKPQDSFGVAIGYRVPDIDFLSGLVLDAFTPFAGVVWKKGDTIENGAVQSDHAYGKPTWVFGLSFNIGKAVDWMKK